MLFYKISFLTRTSGNDPEKWEVGLIYPAAFFASLGKAMNMASNLARQLDYDGFALDDAQHPLDVEGKDIKHRKAKYRKPIDKTNGT